MRLWPSMMASFDDGSSDIPGGIAGRVERVLVIGAGIAGLTVANALAHAGVDCVVLEARRRIGGRLYTADLAGSGVDLGGSWIHHPEGNPLRRFARQVGIECRAGNPLPSLAAFDCATGRWLSPADIVESLSGVQDGYNESLAGLRTRLGPAASAAGGIDVYLATTGLTGDALRRARQALHAGVEADAAGTAEDQSLTWLWTQEEYGSDYFGDLPEGGYASVVGAMAAGLEVRQEWLVVRVELAGGGVTIFVVRRNGTHLGQITPWSMRAGDHPDWSPDGRWILFRSPDDGDFLNSQLYVLHPDGSGLRQITHVSADIMLLSSSFSPDGPRIVYAQTGQDGEPDIFSIRVDGKHTRQATRTALWESAPDWGPRR